MAFDWLAGTQLGCGRSLQYLATWPTRWQTLQIGWPSVVRKFLPRAAWAPPLWKYWFFPFRGCWMFWKPVLMAAMISSFKFNALEAVLDGGFGGKPEEILPKFGLGAWIWPFFWAARETKRFTLFSNSFSLCSCRTDCAPENGELDVLETASLNRARFSASANDFGWLKITWFLVSSHRPLIKAFIKSLSDRPSRWHFLITSSVYKDNGSLGPCFLANSSWRKKKL